MPSEKETREFYWRAMGNGLSLKTKREKKNTVPNHEMFVFREKNLLLVRLRSENALTGSLSEMITIFADDNPVWTLHCSGFCNKLASPFLAGVLSKAFSEGTGLAARGPKEFEGNKYVYINPGQFGFRIDKIRGHEKIIEPKARKSNDKLVARINFFGGFI